LYEHRSHQLAPRHRFALRLLRHLLISAAIIAVSLVGGVLGYEHYEHLGWRDAFLNAAMLLGGMGPIKTDLSEAGKVFAGLYALYSAWCSSWQQACYSRPWCTDCCTAFIVISTRAQSRGRVAATLPNPRLQQPGAPVPSSARVLIAAGDQRNVEFECAGESPAAEA
jgi:hypothetical protein